MVLIEDEIDFAKKINNKLGGYRETDKHKKARYPLENTNLKTITKKDNLGLVKAIYPFVLVITIDYFKAKLVIKRCGF